MFKVLISKTKAAVRYLRRLHAELADAQQYLMPALLVAATAVTASAQELRAKSDDQPAPEAEVRAFEARLTATRARIQELTSPLVVSPSATATDAAVSRSELTAVEERLEPLDQQIRVVQRLQVGSSSGSI